MATTTTTRSRGVRSQLDHPVIDADGHMVEFLAPLEDYVREIGGSKFVAQFGTPFKRLADWSVEELRDSRDYFPVWWLVPTKNTLDRATASLPKLLYERLDDFGIDFTVLFTTDTNRFQVVPADGSDSSDSEATRVWVRAFNSYRADICREYSDRMTPVAVIPMNTPQQAIEEAEFAINVLGLKAIKISGVLRPIKAVQRAYPDFFKSQPALSRVGRWLDNFGVDSEYDYDPFWAKCVELGVPMMFHEGGMGFTSRASPTNYMYNHMGHFASGGEAACKSVFMGGVTRRFPTLRFAFLEGGVATGCRLYSDIVGHWEKRNREAVQNYNPANLDRERFRELHERYGYESMRAKMDRLFGIEANVTDDVVDDPSATDDFAACGIERVEDIRDLFVPSFFFGCEADDPTNAVAFNSQLWPLGARLNALFSSDIGHWDVPDMSTVTAEAYELVERGLLTDHDFRDFTFGNPVKLFTGSNPDFFKGTRIEAEVRAEKSG